MKLIEHVHERLVVGRRARVLAGHMADLLWPSVTVLDVGCGDGQLAFAIQQLRPDVELAGVDVLVREKTWIPVAQFDGMALPYADQAVDVVMLVDVLHHTVEPAGLLREATRVARRGILLKDHSRNGFMAGPTLKFMDVIGNRRHGVALPFNYWPREQWLEVFRHLHLSVDAWRSDLHIYPWPASLLFDRSLHFAARLTHA